MLLVNWKPMEVGCPPAVPPFKPLPQRPPGCCLNGRGACAHRPTRPGPPAPAPVTSPFMQRKFREARLRLRRKNKLAAGDTGRIHVSVQCARGPSEPQTVSRGVQAAAQTDLSPGYFAKPPEAIVKCKTGLDAHTQVTYGDLLDFETEVAPLAKALADVVLRQAADAVLYEDEATALRREQAVYAAKRRAERIELDRLNHVEAGRRRCGLRALALAERAAPEPTFRAIHARALADHYMANLRADALNQLRAAGYLTADDQLAAWTRDRLRGYAERRRRNDVQLDELIRDVIANRPQRYRRFEKRHPRFKEAPPEIIVPDVTFSDAIISDEETASGREVGGRIDDDDGDGER